MGGGKRRGLMTRRSVLLWLALLGPPIVLAGLVAIALLSLKAAGIVALVVLVIVYVLVFRLMNRGLRERMRYARSKEYRERMASLPDDSFPGYLARAADRGRAAIERRAAKQYRAGR
jgi:hypothetical protein